MAARAFGISPHEPRQPFQGHRQPARPRPSLDHGPVQRRYRELLGLERLGQALTAAQSTPSAVVIRRRPPASSVPAPSRPRSSGTPVRTSAAISSFRAASSSIEIRPAPPCPNAPSCHRPRPRSGIEVVDPQAVPTTFVTARSHHICRRSSRPESRINFGRSPRLDERRRSDWADIY